MNKTLILIAIICGLSTIACLNNGLGLTPQMGWNSWNHFACNVNETLIKQTADQIVKLGLDKKGYEYVNIDDCWQVDRYPNGTIIEDPKTFPSGMKALADYVHSKGLKFGLYSDVGFKTCAGRPGGYGYEAIDAKTYADWGVDYLKYDFCNYNGTGPKDIYPVMSAALMNQSRKIFFSMCEWGVQQPATWASQYANSWRTTGDIQDNWGSFLLILSANADLYQYSGPGGWNDPDMLEVGNGGMNYTQYVSHFGFWCLLKAPLILGCDLNNLEQKYVDLISNEEMIAVNQDKLGKQGRRYTPEQEQEIWAGPMYNGDVVAILFNKGFSAANITVEFKTIEYNHDGAYIRDIVNRQDLGQYRTNFTAEVESFGIKMIRLSQNHYTDEIMLENKFLAEKAEKL